MLQKQPWIRTESELAVEWEQAMDEGKEVAYLKEVCQRTASRAGSEEADRLAEQLRLALLAAPVRKDYPYVEPSGLEEIQAARPARRHDFSGERKALGRESLRDKVAGAWSGRISGCLLGKPVEGYRLDRLLPLLKETGNYPLKRYICRRDFSDELVQRLDIWTQACWADNLQGFSPMDDDTNYTVFALKLLEEYGQDFTPDDVLEGWLSWLPMFATCTAERAAYRNAASGLTAPETATWRNPYREWIGAQIRGDLFGYVCPGDPERAAALAFRDASVSHVKNGIYGEMFIAAMLAAAAVCSDVTTVIEAGLDEIPEASRLRRDVEKVLAWRREGLSAQQAMEEIHRCYDEHSSHGWCHTNPNAMIVAMGLLYGEKDYGTSICLGVECGFDTDCNGATIGSIVGMLIGRKAIPACWSQPHNDIIETAVLGCPRLSLSELTDRTLALLQGIS